VAAFLFEIEKTRTLTYLFNGKKHVFDGISFSMHVNTVINTVKFDGMSIDFIGTHRKRKTP